jgi:Protein of unknown function (DUF2950)
MITILNRTPCRARLAWLTAAVLAFSMASVANAQQSFKTAQEAVDALVSAAKTGDRKRILTVLGRDGADIVSSGDTIADASARNRVIEAYDAKHQVVMEETDKAVLIIGQEDWPFPIPLVRKDSAWRFDTAAGREEILYRRIGRNELSAIETCLAYVDAQQEYAEAGVAGNGVYAQRIVSRQGKKDGLYWPAQSSADESPLGELAGQCRRGGLSRRPAARALSRLLLQGSHQARTELVRRRTGLCRARQDDRRLRVGGLSGGVRKLGRNDVSR